VVETKPESTGGKVIRHLFAYCDGIEGMSSASVELINDDTKNVLARLVGSAVVWAYQVQKKGADNHQSKAEAIAKYLKAWIDKQNPKNGATEDGFLSWHQLDPGKDESANEPRSPSR
jgi:hypothetical protein